MGFKKIIWCVYLLWMFFVIFFISWLCDLSVYLAGPGAWWSSHAWGALVFPSWAPCEPHRSGTTESLREREREREQRECVEERKDQVGDITEDRAEREGGMGEEKGEKRGGWWHEWTRQREGKKMKCMLFPGSIINTVINEHGDQGSAPYIRSSSYRWQGEW